MTDFLHLHNEHDEKINQIEWRIIWIEKNLKKKNCKLHEEIQLQAHLIHFFYPIFIHINLSSFIKMLLENAENVWLLFFTCKKNGTRVKVK